MIKSQLGWPLGIQHLIGRAQTTRQFRGEVTLLGLVKATSNGLRSQSSQKVTAGDWTPEGWPPLSPCFSPFKLVDSVGDPLQCPLGEPCGLCSWRNGFRKIHTSPADPRFRSNPEFHHTVHIIRIPRLHHIWGRQNLTFFSSTWKWKMGCFIFFIWG